MSLVAYDVLYSKDRSKKRKVFQDGTLSVSSNTVTLTSSDGTTLIRRTLNDREIGAIAIGMEVPLSIYDVQIERLANGVPAGLSDGAITVKKNVGLENFGVMKSSKRFKPVDQTKSSSGSAPIDKAETVPGNNGLVPFCGVKKANVSTNKPLEIDYGLKVKLRPHQLTACEFLFRALETQVDDSAEASETFGAILADEMGLGKSLTAICVLWSYIRRDKCKCVIVCPSSLVNNWKKEVKRW